MVNTDLWSHLSAWPNSCSENTIPDSTVKLNKVKPMLIMRNNSFSMVSSAGSWSSAEARKPLRSVPACRRFSCSAISTAWKAATVSVL